MDDVSTIDFLNISMIHNLSIRWFNGLSSQIWMTVCQVQINPTFFIRRNSDERERERIHHRSDGRSGSQKRKEFGILVFEKTILVLKVAYLYFMFIY